MLISRTDEAADRVQCSGIMFRRYRSLPIKRRIASIHQIFSLAFPPEGKLPLYLHRNVSGCACKHKILRRRRVILQCCDKIIVVLPSVEVQKGALFVRAFVSGPLQGKVHFLPIGSKVIIINYRAMMSIDYGIEKRAFGFNFYFLYALMAVEPIAIIQISISSFIFEGNGVPVSQISRSIGYPPSYGLVEATDDSQCARKRGALH